MSRARDCPTTSGKGPFVEVLAETKDSSRK